MHDVVVETITWRELHRTLIVHEARTLIVCLAAMSFPVCARDAYGDIDIDALFDNDVPARLSSAISIDVPAAHHDELSDIIDELLDEQRDFDALLARRDHISMRAHWIAILLVLAFGALMFGGGLISI
ncbi:MAG: hypothetical protein AAF432_03455 [Planctomycetota bacterium]